MRLEMVGHGIWRLRELGEGAKKGVSAGFVQTRVSKCKKGVSGALCGELGGLVGQGWAILPLNVVE